MELDTNEKHMSPHAFKGELELMVAKVMNMVTKQQDVTGSVLSFNRKTLMECMESFMPQEDHYVVEVPFIDYPGGLGPFFSKLPRELRDHIFSDLLVSGDPQFIALSRAMKFEGMALIYKKGVYRINIGYDVLNRKHSLGNCPSPTQETAESIQNFCIRVSTGSFPLCSTAQGLDETRGSFLVRIKSLSFPRGICNIVLAFENNLGTNLMVLFTIFRSPMAFIKLDTLVFRVDVDASRSATFPKNSTRSFARRMIWLTDLAFTKAQEFLEPHLGKGEMGSDKDGLRLVFYPRKAREETISKSGQELEKIEVLT